MIFSIGDHIERIKVGTKIVTRRPTNRYKVGQTYSIQPGRGKKGIQDGRIKILDCTEEHRLNYFLYPISDIQAYYEGGYSWEAFEELYEKMYPNWEYRYAYRFVFVPKPRCDENESK